MNNLYTKSNENIFLLFLPLIGVMKRGHQWNLQAVLPRYAPRVLSISRGGAGRGKDCFLRGGAACFSTGRGGAGRGDHPCLVDQLSDIDFSKRSFPKCNVPSVFSGRHPLCIAQNLCGPIHHHHRHLQIWFFNGCNRLFPTSLSPLSASVAPRGDFKQHCHHFLTLFIFLHYLVFWTCHAKQQGRLGTCVCSVTTTTTTIS